MQKLNLDIVNLVGISLLVVALVSAGGLAYTASTWTNISEAYATIEVGITNVTASFDNSTGQVTINTLFLVNNPSQLDIEVYRIEYLAHADNTPASITDYDKYVGSGAVGNRNNTVTADSMRSIPLTMTINPDTPYMERFTSANHDGSVYIFISGILWYRISNFPEATQRLDGVFFMGVVTVHEG